jgi:tRNA-dihydrouridine synthase B
MELDLEQEQEQEIGSSSTSAPAASPATEARHPIRGFVIGRGEHAVSLENPLVLAPMAGVCDMPYRILCKEMGCALVYTEMISAMGLKYGDRTTLKILEIDKAEWPVAAQVFGSDPDVVALAAGIMQERGAAMIDINMGCPVPKIVKGGEGCALMRRPELAATIVRRVKQSVGIPVTVKMRKGWDEHLENAVEVAQACEEAGADAIAVHGRTREQGYSGRADWDVIARVAAAVKVAVIGNGDVVKPSDAVRLMEHTGCSGVMIGRAAMGNPWIFSRTLSYMATGEEPPEPSAAERLQVALRHLEMSAAFKGEKVASREMRKHLAWYIRGLRGSARMREVINSASSVDSLRQAITRYLADLSAPC